MKKKRLIRFPSLLKRYKKNLMIMKWCIAFICLFTLNLSANVYSQKNIVSLDLSDVSVEQFVKAVKQQTSLKFVSYSSDWEDFGESRKQRVEGRSEHGVG